MHWRGMCSGGCLPWGTGVQKDGEWLNNLHHGAAMGLMPLLVPQF